MSVDPLVDVALTMPEGVHTIAVALSWGDRRTNTDKFLEHSSGGSRTCEVTREQAPQLNLMQVLMAATALTSGFPMNRVLH